MLQRGLSDRCAASTILEVPLRVEPLTVRKSCHSIERSSFEGKKFMDSGGFPLEFLRLSACGLFMHCYTFASMTE